MQVVPQYTNFEGRALAVPEHEPKRRTGAPLPLDVSREPGSQVLGLGQSQPDLCGWMRESAREAQSPPVVALFEFTVHLFISPVYASTSGMASRCSSRSSSRASQ